MTRSLRLASKFRPGLNQGVNLLRWLVGCNSFRQLLDVCRGLHSRSQDDLCGHPSQEPSVSVQSFQCCSTIYKASFASPTIDTSLRRGWTPQHVRNSVISVLSIAASDCLRHPQPNKAGGYSVLKFVPCRHVPAQGVRTNETCRGLSQRIRRISLWRWLRGSRGSDLDGNTALHCRGGLRGLQGLRNKSGFAQLSRWVSGQQPWKCF